MTDDYRRSVLVVGAAEGSLGATIAAALPPSQFDVNTAGIGEEMEELDITDSESVRQCLAFGRDAPYTDVVCTAGVNWEGPIDVMDFQRLLMEYQINAVGPMLLLHEWLKWRRPREDGPGHFVAISSNSAHIARSASLGYCASKAALSMSVRCAARYVAQHGPDSVIYGYEPGALRGTPMTEAVAERLPEGTPMSRIPGWEGGFSVDSVAALIVRNLMFGSHYMNGTMTRLDGGEQ